MYLRDMVTICVKVHYKHCIYINEKGNKLFNKMKTRRISPIYSCKPHISNESIYLFQYYLYEVESRRKINCKRVTKLSKMILNKICLFEQVSYLKKQYTKFNGISDKVYKKRAQTVLKSELRLRGKLRQCLWQQNTLRHFIECVNRICNKHCYYYALGIG